MKYTSLIAVILVFILPTQAQENSKNDYIQDTVWLKSGLVMSCLIIADSSNSNYIYVNYADAVGQVDHTHFNWEQIKRVNKQSKPFVLLSSVYTIELIDGTTLKGILLSETEEEVEIQLESIGTLKVNRAKIRKLIPQVASKEIKKSYWFKNPHATRLLFAPTAIPLKKGEGYYQNIYIVGNMFNYGLTNNFSIGGGFDFITMFANTGGNWSPMLNVNIKSGFKVSDNFHVGVGGIFVLLPEEGSAGIGYGLATVGSYNSNLTLGAGWGFIDETFEPKPFIMIGGMARIAEKLWFVSENWFAPVSGDDYYLIVSYGVRFAAKRIAVDLAFINSKDIVSVIPIGFPFVDFVIKFGK